MSFSISRRKMKTFVATGFPELLDMHRVECGLPIHKYITHAAEEFETTKQTILNWYGGLTTPSGCDFAFVLFKTGKEISINHNGELCFVSFNSTPSNQNATLTGIPRIVKAGSK